MGKRIYKSERGYEIDGYEWALGWPLSFGYGSSAQSALEIIQAGIDKETAPLREELTTQAVALEAQSAEIKRLQSKIRGACNCLTMGEYQDAFEILQQGLNPAPKSISETAFVVQAPDAPVSAPKFRVGDRVSFSVKTTDEYKGMVGKIEDCFNGGYSVTLEGLGELYFAEFEVIPYTEESESDKQA